MPQKILIVDDEADIRAALRWTLSPVADVIEASNGLDALALLQRDRPRLMLLDLVMPDMGGLDVLAAARRIDPAVVVVMLTGDADVDSAVRALECGARAYVTKPFDPEYLRGEVQRLLEPAPKPGDAPWRVAGS